MAEISKSDEISYLMDKIRYLEHRLYSRIETNREKDKDFLVMVAFLELTDRESYIKIVNMIKYYSNKKLLSTDDIYEKEILRNFITSPVEFHEFTEEEKKYVFEEAQKLYEEGIHNTNDEEKLRLEKLSEKADLFAASMEG